MALGVSWVVWAACGSETPSSSPAAAPPVTPAAAPPVASVAAEAVRVELTYDVVCPWCRIGHARLMRAIEAYGRPVEVVYRPFLLEPDLPPGGEDLRARLGAKYGADRVEGMFARVTEIGARDGIHFDFGKVERSPSSVLAHVLIGAAPAASQHALVEAIQAAYFERGEDIGDAAVLERLWVGVGLPAADGRAALADEAARQRVRSEARAAARAGVDGVPSFTIGEARIGGAQPTEALVKALEAARRP